MPCAHWLCPGREVCCENLEPTSGRLLEASPATRIQIAGGGYFTAQFRTLCRTGRRRIYQYQADASLGDRAEHDTGTEWQPPGFGAPICHLRERARRAHGGSSSKTPAVSLSATGPLPLLRWECSTAHQSCKADRSIQQNQRPHTGHPVWIIGGDSDSRVRNPAV